MRKLLRWVLKSLLALVAIAVLAFGVLYVVGGRKWKAPQRIAVSAIPIPSTPERIESGRHLASIHCANCHAEDLGGKMFVEDSAFAVVAAPNLTGGEGGIAGQYEPEDWVRAVRHAVGADGRALFVMPAEIYYFLSDEDLGSIVAFLEQARVDRRFAKPAPGPVGRVLRATGALSAAFPFEFMAHDAPRPAAPPPGPTAEYGAYMARTFGCHVCHGEELSGGIAAGTEDVAAVNITPGGPIGAWTEELFLENIRTRESEHMPWRGLRAMSGDEQRALWRFLSTLPKRPSTVPQT